jgi:group I intron endonuclease
MLIRTNIPKKASGVYIITSSKNGKRYVGSAVNLKSRLRHHFNLLRNKNHDNIHLQRHVNKYDIIILWFGILEFCPPEKCIEREQYWIDTLHLFTKTGRPLEFNICPKAESTLGRKQKKSASEKVRKALTGRIRSEEMCRKNSEGHIAFYQSEEGLLSRKKASEQQLAFYQTERGITLKKKNSDDRKAFYQTEEGKALAKATGMARRNVKRKPYKKRTT